MASTLNPYAPEFRPSPTAAAASNFIHCYVPPPQQIWFSSNTFAYFPQRDQPQYFYSDHARIVHAAPVPAPANLQPPPQPRLRDASINRPGEQPEGRSRNRDFPVGTRRRRGVSGGGGRDIVRYINNGGEGNRRSRHRAIMPLECGQNQTTVLIKNIPYDCSRDELINFLDGFCASKNVEAASSDSSLNENPIAAYDFLYLPIDFRSKRGRGFAFVNFNHPITAWKFFQNYNNRRWDSAHSINWHKILVIASAQLQGRRALVDHFTGSIFRCKKDDYLPVCFDPARDGSGQSVIQTIVGTRVN